MGSTDEEPIDVLTSDGRPTGRIKPKSEVHRDGDWHASVHLWLVTDDGMLVLQQRAAEKKTHPLLWDISVAGHISAGEDAVTSALREAEEELGVKLSADELRHVATLRTEWLLNDGTHFENEVNEVYVARWNGQLSELRLQPGEVAAVRLISLTELRERAERRDPTLVPHWEELELITRM
jgi:isopentenyl-diphosphate delta-isomerase